MRGSRSVLRRLNYYESHSHNSSYENTPQSVRCKGSRTCRAEGRRGDRSWVGCNPLSNQQKETKLEKVSWSGGALRRRAGSQLQHYGLAGARPSISLDSSLPLLSSVSSELAFRSFARRAWRKPRTTLPSAKCTGVRPAYRKAKRPWHGAKPR